MASDPGGVQRFIVGSAGGAGVHAVLTYVLQLIKRTGAALWCEKPWSDSRAPIHRSGMGHRAGTGWLGTETKGSVRAELVAQQRSCKQPPSSSEQGLLLPASSLPACCMPGIQMETIPPCCRESRAS